MDKNIQEEIKRFQQIDGYVDNLNEQMVTTGLSAKLAQLKKEIAEQEDIETIEMGAEEEGTEEDIETIELGDEEGLPTEEGGEDIDMETEIEVDDTVENSTEVEVTDIVTAQDEIQDKITDQADILDRNTKGLEDLMSKLQDLEDSLSTMDTLVNTIEDLEKKIEDNRPLTPEEKMALRKHDSGPYTNTLTDFFVDKKDMFEKTGKKQYILKPDDVENYNEVDIKQSFNTPEED